MGEEVDHRRQEGTDQKQLGHIRDRLARQHEEGVCRNFLESYNSRTGTRYQFVRLQNPPAPDALCSPDLQIEVTTAYLNDDAAELLWDMLVKNAVGRKLPFSRLTDCNDSDQTGLAAIDNAVAKKGRKHYSVKGRLWLVVDVRSPLMEWFEIEAEYLSGRHDLPAGEFDKIWLMMSDGDCHHIGEVSFSGDTAGE